MSLLCVGQTIGSTYEVERFLGEGAFAEVYRVRHRFLGRQAMKVFKLVGMTRQETEQALSEAMILSQIGHPNIVRVFDANVAETPRGSFSYFTMEYVAGGNLEQYWKSFGSQYVPVEQVVDVVAQIARGLAVAHSEKPPIIHRDVKPQNILVGYDSAGLRTRLGDFGLAKQTNPLTMLASVRGTRSFKAPETLHNAQCDSTAGDVWAVGQTMYLLLTDRLAFSGSERDLLDEESFSRPLIAPSRLNLRVDPLLETITLKALALDPSQRYSTAMDLLKDLSKWSPERVAPLKAPGSSNSSKTVLSLPTPVDVDLATEMIVHAKELSRHVGRLSEAADLMEEAFNKAPQLRDKFEYTLRLWRRGIVS